MEEMRTHKVSHIISNLASVNYSILKYYFQHLSHDLDVTKSISTP